MLPTKSQMSQVLKEGGDEARVRGAGVTHGAAKIFPIVVECPSWNTRLPRATSGCGWVVWMEAVTVAGKSGTQDKGSLS